MPFHYNKHTEQGTLILENFRGGINVSVARTMIKPNECEWIENLYLDFASGRLVTRLPLRKYSNSAPSVSDKLINGLFYWNNEWYFTCNDTLYYLDSSLDPISVGALTGSTRPTFLGFNGFLIIASGGTLQKCTTAHAISTISGAPKAKYLFQKDCRIYASGDEDNPDRIHLSNVQDETTWSAGATDYADVAYKDDMDVVGMVDFAEGIILVFKRGTGRVATHHFTTVSANVAEADILSTTHCPISHYSVVDAYNQLYFAEQKTFNAIMGIEATGKLAVDPMVGKKLSSIMKADATGFAVTLPAHGQIWFVPKETATKIYICDYLRIATDEEGRPFRIHPWVSFSFPSRKICSAHYLPNDGYLYIGSDDGFIYKYGEETSDYRDLHGDGTYHYIPQYLRTAVFTEPEPKREKIIKDPLLYYEGLKAGLADSVSFKIMKNFGKTAAYSTTFTISESKLKVWDTQGIRVYDTQEGESNEMRMYDIGLYGVYEQQKFPIKKDVDNSQIRIEVSSGALRIDQIQMDVALGRKQL